MHIHMLRWVKLTPNVVCDECGLSLRLALFHEAVWIQRNDAFEPDGPMNFGDGGAIVVPHNFSIPKGA